MGDKIESRRRLPVYEENMKDRYNDPSLQLGYIQQVMR